MAIKQKILDGVKKAAGSGVGRKLLSRPKVDKPDSVDKGRGAAMGGAAAAGAGAAAAGAGASSKQESGKYEAWRKQWIDFKEKKSEATKELRKKRASKDISHDAYVSALAEWEKKEDALKAKEPKK